MRVRRPGRGLALPLSAAPAKLPGMAMAQQAMKARRVPPHLRAASGGDPDGDGIPDRCGTCVHFSGGAKGTCRLYNYPVSSGQLCDSYRARKGG
jgi:hypothetical protein